MKENQILNYYKIISGITIAYGIATILATILLSISLVRGYDMHGGFDGMNLLFFPFFLLIIIGLAVIALGCAVFVIIVGVLGFNYARNPTSHDRIVLIILASINMFVIHGSGVVVTLALTNGSSPIGVLNTFSLVLSILLLVGSIVTDVRQG